MRRKRLALAMAPAACAIGLWVSAGDASAGMCMGDTTHGPAGHTTCSGAGDTFAAGINVEASAADNNTATATGNDSDAECQSGGTVVAGPNESVVC